MTTATRHLPDPATTSRSVEQVLAHTHLRLGSLALARTELETLAGLGKLDPDGLVDLAEVRWRTGDLAGAGEAAAAALRGDEEFPIALVIAAEAAAALGRPSEARRLSSRAMAAATGSIDAIFAGMHRSTAWPPDADEPPPTAPTLFDRPEEPEPRTEEKAAATDDGAPAAAAPGSTGAGPMTLGLWDEDAAEEPGSRDLPDAALELEAGHAALVAGNLEDAALRFGVALRFAPSLAPAVLEATAGARVASLSIVRGDAYRLTGHELEAREAYLVAANGGLPERRKRKRVKTSKAGAGSTDSDLAPLETPEVAAQAGDLDVDATVDGPETVDATETVDGPETADAEPPDPVVEAASEDQPPDPADPSAVADDEPPT
jgi:tetratricopeptide (TPR) repeat protein